MIITKTDPFTKEEIEKLQEAHGPYIKAVIDLEKKICSAGAKVHRQSKDVLVEQGSDEHAVWGGGIILDTKEITFTSMINIRPLDGNTSNYIEDAAIRNTFEENIRYFFKEVLWKNFLHCA